MPVVCTAQSDSNTAKTRRALYVKAYNSRRSETCLPLADSLLIMARAAGDHRAELNALNVQLLYEFYKPDNQDIVSRKAAILLEKSEEYHNEQMYYSTVSNEILYLVREQRFLDAIIKADEQLEKARQKQSPRGLRSCYRLLGMIFQYREQLGQAIYYFNKSIEYSEKYNQKDYLFYSYMALADCYRTMGNYPKMKEALDKAEPHSNSETTLRNVLANRAYYCAMTNDVKGFISYDDKYRSIKGAMLNLHSAVQLALKVFRDIVDGCDQEKDYQKLESMSAKEYRRARDFKARVQGDYKTAAQWMQAQLDRHFIFGSYIFECDKKNREDIFTDYHTRSERQRLLNANTQLELDNTNKALHNSELELEQSRNSAMLSQAEADHDSLSVKRQQLTHQQLQNALENRQLETQAANSHMRTQKRMLTCMLIAATIALMVISIHYIRRRMLVRRILKANKQMAETIQKVDNAKRRAQESEAMKSRFLQNMSHEIRTPLNAIVGFADVLTHMEDELTEEEKKDLTEKICENSIMMTTLVNDILDITSIESGQFELNIKTIGVNALCRDALDTVRGRKAPDVELRFESFVDESFTIDTDPYRIKQVLLNLLTNAEKNTEHGYILLDCMTDANQEWLTFTVTDTGIGVPKEKMEQIFKRYNKLDNKKQGSGLGLDICRLIAKRFGGAIDIDRTYFNGARFWFKIPIKK